MIAGVNKPSESPQVTVLIVNWNGAAVLSRCLAAVFAQTYRDFEVLVVDNGSTDGSADGLEDAWPGVRVVRLAENSGFAAGNNSGAALARGRWLALLNADAFPEAGWLAALLVAAETQPDGTCFASQLVMAGDPARLDGTGDVYHASGMVWRRHYGQLAAFGQQAGEVFSPCAAAALYDRDWFLRLGGFDTALFSYLEDVDLGFRWRLAGGRCWYVPEAVVTHVGSASQGAHSAFNIYYGQRNVTRVFVKNMPREWLALLLPLHLAVLAFFTAVYALRGQGGAVLRARWDALRGLPQTWRDRRTVQALRTVSGWAVVRQFSWDLLALLFRSRR